MIFTFTTLCLSKQSLPPPSLIHSAPACYIVYVIWSGLNIIYYLLFHYYSVIPSEHRGLKPLSGGQHIVPPELSWVTYYPAQRWWWGPRCEMWGQSHGTITLCYKDTSLVVCKVYFSPPPPPPLVKPIAKWPRCAWYTAVCARGQHFLAKFFQSSPGYFAGCLSPLSSAPG